MARVLVTRPQPEADKTAAALLALGYDPLIDPMREVRLVPGPPIELGRVQALLTTSPNGVRAAAARTDRRDIRLFTVGPHSAEIARSFGFTDVKDTGGAAADLVACVGLTVEKDAGRLIHVSGTDLAIDVAALLTTHGYRVTRIIGYEAAPVTELSIATQTAIESASLPYASFFSARTARTFLGLLQTSGHVPNCRKITALCLSAGVAAALGGVRWNTILIAPAPNSEALLRLLPKVADRRHPG